MRPIRPTASGVRAASRLIGHGAHEGLRLAVLLAPPDGSFVRRLSYDVAGEVGSINDAAEPGATCSDAPLAPALSHAPKAGGSV